LISFRFFVPIVIISDEYLMIFGPLLDRKDHLRFSLLSYFVMTQVFRKKNSADRKPKHSNPLQQHFFWKVIKCELLSDLQNASANFIGDFDCCLKPTGYHFRLRNKRTV